MKKHPKSTHILKNIFLTIIQHVLWASEVHKINLGKPISVYGEQNAQKCYTNFPKNDPKIPPKKGSFFMHKSSTKILPPDFLGLDFVNL